jgi:hypothetical protein
MFVDRRAFLAAGTAAAAGALFAAPAAAQKPGATPVPPAAVDPKGRRKIYRLSLRGRRGSRFAKRYNANMRFATKEMADRHRAFPGDRSRTVPLTVSVNEYHRLFVNRHSLVADLRTLRGITVVGVRG